MNSLLNTIRINKLNANLKEYLKFLLGIPLTLLSFIFIGKFLYSGRQELFEQFQNFDALPFFLGIFFLLLFFLFRSLVWKNLLLSEGHPLDTIQSTFLLANAEIKRYIPGSVLAFISRVHSFGSLSVPARSVIKLILYESILFLITSVLISIPAALYFFPGIPILIFILILAIASLVLFGIFKRKILNFLDINIETPFLLMLCAWVFYGLGNYLISASIIFIDPAKIIEYSSFYVFAWLAGYLVLIVPMGLGVREGIIALGLSSLMPISVAAAVALITRIVFVLSEILFLVASYLAHKLTPQIAIRFKFRIEGHLLILWVSIISYISYFTYYSFARYTNFFTGRFDLGNMDQTVWNTLNGRIFQLTNPDGLNTISRLSIHSDFILILLAPFYLIWEDPRTLLLIQTVVLGLGAYFVFKIADKILRNYTISIVLAVSFLLNPFVQKQNLFDFHAVVLSTTFLLAAFYFMLLKKYKYFLIFIVLAVLTKENVFLIAGVFGFYLYLKTKDKRWLWLFFIGVGSFYLIIAKLIPWARGGQHFATEYFSDFGDSPSKIIANLIFNPLKTISTLFSQSGLSYLYKLFLPVGFVTVLSPFLILFVSSDLAINLLARNENFRSLTFHYSATIIPFVYITAIYGIKRLLFLRYKLLNTKIISYFLLLFSLIATYQYGVLPGAKNPSIEVFNNPVPDKERIGSFLTLIPQDLSVASSNNLGAHLSHRENIYTIPYGINEADVVVFLLNDPYAQPSLAEQKEYARIIQNNKAYIEIYRNGDFIAFAKISAAAKIPSAY